MTHAPTQKQAPYTFFLPDPRRLEALEPGDHAKLIFVPTTEGTKYGAERMWVHIIEKEGTIYRGKLDNIPDDVPGLSLGDIVKFEAWHIIDAKFHDKQKEKSLKFPRRTFYERCLVDKCVLDDGTKVHFIYRENADLTDDGDKYPDSGWRIRACPDCSCPASPEGPSGAPAPETVPDHTADGSLPFAALSVSVCRLPAGIPGLWP